MSVSQVTVPLSMRLGFGHGAVQALPTAVEVDLGVVAQA